MPFQHGVQIFEAPKLVTQFGLAHLNDKSGRVRTFIAHVPGGVFRFQGFCFVPAAVGISVAPFLGGLFQVGGELVEGGLQIGNRATDQPGKQSGVFFTHYKTNPSFGLRRKRERPFASEQTERHAAGPDHAGGGREFGDAHRECSAGIDFGVDGEALARRDRPFDLGDGVVPDGILSGVVRIAQTRSGVARMAMVALKDFIGSPILRRGAPIVNALGGSLRPRSADFGRSA